MNRKEFFTDDDREQIIAQARTNGEYPQKIVYAEDGNYIIFDVIPPNRGFIPKPTIAELQEQQIAQAEAIAAIFEMLTGGA